MAADTAANICTQQHADICAKDTVTQEVVNKKANREADQRAIIHTDHRTVGLPDDAAVGNTDDNANDTTDKQPDYPTDICAVEEARPQTQAKAIRVQPQSKPRSWAGTTHVYTHAYTRVNTHVHAHIYTHVQPQLQAHSWAGVCARTHKPTHECAPVHVPISHCNTAQTRVHLGTASIIRHAATKCICKSCA